jgi:hypothetical protein
LIVAVLGTFLPWLHSGRSDRNLYHAAGVLRRLGLVHGAANVGLAVAPYLGIACAAAMACLALGAQRLAAALGAVDGVVAGAGAVAALTASGDASASPAAVGPIVTLIGGLCAGVAIAALSYARPMSRR